MQQKSSLKKSILQPTLIEDDYKLTTVEGVKISKNNSLTKFLKRKPDPNKNTNSAINRKKRENSVSEYFPVSDKSNDTNCGFLPSSQTPPLSTLIPRNEGKT